VDAIAEEVVSSQVPAQAVQEKWQAVGRWMGTALRRGDALRGDRCRRGWTCNVPEPEDPFAKLPEVETAPTAAPTVDVDDTAFITSVGAEPQEEEPSSHPSNPVEPDCLQTVDSDEELEEATMEEAAFTVTPAEAMIETSTVMREQERPLRDLFRACASIKVPDGPQLMARTDLHNFFDDLRIADPLRHKLAHPSVLDRLYDEAVTLQCNFTKIGLGLSFWSFKAVLNNVIYELGLATGWRRLVAATFSANPDEGSEGGAAK
jgi:hypothetical protein